MTKLIALQVVLYLAIGVTSAQETVRLEIAYEHNVLTPGQAQTISVFAHFEPGLGATVPWNTPPGTGQMGHVVAFAEAKFHLMNLGNAESGLFSNLALNPLLFGSIGATSSGGSVLGVHAYQWENLSTLANPILLWQATWTPTDYSARTVSLETSATSNPFIFLDIGLSSLAADEWTPLNVQRSFQIIPSPSTMGCGLLAFFFAMRRRRTPFVVPFPMRGGVQGTLLPARVGLEELAECSEQPESNVVR